jgi:uncharacterized membrane protein YbhN (UPF0104 family)
MQLTPLAAHGTCALLFLADLLARALRIRWYLAGLGRRISLFDAFQLNAWGDAAAGLTPMRFGGELAKFAGLARCRVPAPVAVAALSLEATVTYPLVALFGAGLAVWFAPEWWEEARPAVESALSRRWPAVAVAGALLLTVGSGIWWWRRRGRGASAPGPSRAALKSFPLWPVLAGIPLSLFNVVARTLMLPLLAMTLPVHPPFGVMAVGSFVLLYSQLVLPTPAGVGAVEFGFLSGMAGDLGDAPTPLLLAWRLYTVGAGALLGAGLAVASFGIRPIIAAVTRVAGRSRPA